MSDIINVTVTETEPIAVTVEEAAPVAVTVSFAPGILDVDQQAALAAANAPSGANPYLTNETAVALAAAIEDAEILALVSL